MAWSRGIGYLTRSHLTRSALLTRATPLSTITARSVSTSTHQNTQQNHENTHNNSNTRSGFNPRYAAIAGVVAGMAVMKTALCDDASEIKSAESRSILKFLRTCYGFVTSWIPKREKKLLPDVEKDSYGRVPRTIVIAFENVVADPTWDRHNNWSVNPREGAIAFVNYLKREGFEVVIWSRNRTTDAQGHVEIFDESSVKAKLFGDDVIYKDGHMVFDLESLNRDMRRVVLIDYDPDSAKVFPGNALIIPKWKHGIPDELSLYKVSLFLTELNRYNIPDCRSFVAKYNENSDSLKRIFRIYKEKEAESRKLLGLPAEVHDRTAVAKMMSQVNVPVTTELDPESQQLQQVWVQQISEHLRQQRQQQQ